MCALGAVFIQSIYVHNLQPCKHNTISSDPERERESKKKIQKQELGWIGKEET